MIRLLPSARLLASAIFLVAFVGVASAQTQPSPVRDSVARTIVGDSPRPRLVVVICIDQFRADYLTRCADLFLPEQRGEKLGGFQYLMHQGAYFANARYEHVPLFTGPGHAVILTGGHPCKTGIVGNEWWDFQNRRREYCVDDRQAEVVGAIATSKAHPMGPRNLCSSTVGDELRLATAGHAKVVTMAIKDRAAILMGGHATNVCIWFDSAGGLWISSTAYCREKKLPEWVDQLNSEHIPDKTLGHDWSPMVSQAAIEQRTLSPKSAGKDLPAGMGERFPHKVGEEKTPANYRAFILTPDANAFVFETARRAVESERLGQDEVPDILAISLSTNDYVGHAFGPNSPEALDLTVRTDGQLSEFFNFLAKAVPGGMNNVVIVLTADHGIVPVPEVAAAPPFNLNAGRYKVQDVLKAIGGSLTTRFGEPAGGMWFAKGDGEHKESGAFLDGFISLNPDAIAKVVSEGKARTRRDIEQAACDGVAGAAIPGVFACYGRTQILEGAIGDNDLKDRLARAIYPSRSSDLIIVPEQMYVYDPDPEGHLTTHGTPYVYDAHVPVLLCAPGLVKPGVYLDSVAPSDIAPTLSLLLGIEFPSACDGKPLLPALMP